MFDFLFKRQPKAARKVFVLGLDCAAPELVFQRWPDLLPNLTALRNKGLWGVMKSCTPAITVPAWSSMLSSKDPGELGIYGFRNRADYSYDKQFVATGQAVKQKRVWDYLSEAGKQSVVIGVPQTYPVKPLNGHLIAGFLAPNTEAQFTHPPTYKQEVLQLAPDYAFDVKGFRTDDKAWLLEEINAMTRTRIKVVDEALRNKPWDFFMYMEIGVDRIHHGFWAYHDPEHRRYEPGNPFENAIRDYYIMMDKQLGEWLPLLGDDTAILVVSDHGAKRMDGGIAVNEWLWRNGYLAFHEDPVEGQITRFDDMKVDWSRTKAWGDGGYYGRVFLNVAGREPEGIVAPEDYEALRDELKAKFEAMTDPNGVNIGTRVFKPQDIYRTVRGVAPDLMVYWGDLYWRSVGTLGYGGWHTFDNDTGPDDCNHAEDGMVIVYDPAKPGGGRELKGAQLMDVAPTVLTLLNQPVPGDMQGQVLMGR